MQSILESNDANSKPTCELSLDDFQQAALLAFYALFELPGDKSLSRVAFLTRKAYLRGMHQLDNPDQ